MDERSDSLIYKIREDALGDPEQLFTEPQEEAVGYALSEIRHQLRTEFKAAHGRIEHN